MNNKEIEAMQMALGAMLTAKNTLIFKCGGDMRPMERETLDDLLEAITSIQTLSAQQRLTDDELFSAYWSGCGVNNMHTHYAPDIRGLRAVANKESESSSMDSNNTVNLHRAGSFGGAA